MSRESDEAWRRFDLLVVNAATNLSPWTGPNSERKYEPDLTLLAKLLGVPVELGCSTQSGIPAKAVDVWLSNELRRSGFDPDAVWPRSAAPRVLTVEVAHLIEQLPRNLASQLRQRLEEGRIGGDVASMDAHVLGKAYRKQVDVVMAKWSRGVELMISTKRMDSSLGKNALNRIEESYGDAKNLKGRHPLAALGYVLVLRRSAIVAEQPTAERLMDLLSSLAKESDAYDATALVIADWTSDGSVDVTLFQDEVPKELRIEDFMSNMVSFVLDRTPIDYHVHARELRMGHALPLAEDGVG